MSLDPQVNRAAREEVELAANEAPPLEAAWPGVRLAFDPWFFGVEVEPPRRWVEAELARVPE